MEVGPKMESPTYSERSHAGGTDVGPSDQSTYKPIRSWPTPDPSGIEIPNYARLPNA